MDSKQRDIDEGMRVYKEFEPTFDWVPEEDCDTLVVYLPGFKKEQLRVQLTRTKNLIISGERQTEDNTWTRFRKQFAVSTNCDANGISARFEAGILYVRQPKLIMSTEKQAEEIAKSTITEPLKPQKSTESEPQAQNTTKEQANIPQTPPRVPTPMKMSTNEKEKKMANEELQYHDSRSSSKKEGKDEVTNNGMEYKRTEEEKKENVEESMSDKRLSDGSVIDGNENEEKRRAEIDYKRAVGDLATNVKRRPKLVMIMALAIVMASVVGMYILKAAQFRSPTKQYE